MQSAGDERRVGRYRLERRLGRGGMGEVWAAVLEGPAGFRKPVALKLLRRRAGPAEAEAIEALRHEARLGALLSHPNLVGTYELGQADGRWFVAMELVRGPSATDLLRQGPLPPRAVLEVGIQACAGLNHAHATGLVHRDIKPGNLLIDRTGLVKVADLGIARLSGSSGPIAGTPGYMAPEQSAGTDDTRTDLFALGATLYALALRKAPFGTGNEATLATMAVERRLKDPSFLGPLDAAVPGLGPIVAHCLRARPQDRIADAATLGDALRELRGVHAATPGLLDVLGAGPDTPSMTPSPPTRSTPGRPVRRATDRFWGREAEAATLTDALRSGARWITLLGPGGIGKTRLATEVAGQLGASFPGGVVFVDASAATDAATLCRAVAAGLGVPLVTGHARTVVSDALQSRGRTLLLVDNLDSVAEAAGPILVGWLTDATEAAFLVTSRVTTRARPERVVAVGPLDLDASAALFMDRAAQPPPDDRLDDVRALVRDLDGLPLAIELAAARTRLMSLDALRERLADRFRLLSGGDGSRPQRHRSLRASLDASWELLGPWERAAMAQLCVFADGWTLEAADAVLDLGAWPDAPWTLDVLASLLDRSLIQLGDHDRFRMLVAVHAYVSEHAGDDDTVRRYVACFAQLGSDEAMASRAARPEEGERSHRELGNLIAACRSALRLSDGEDAARCALAAAEVLRRAGPLVELGSLLSDVLAAQGLPDGLRRRLRLARLTALDADAAIAEVDSLVAESVAAGDREQEVLARLEGAGQLRTGGDIAGALAAAERALAVAEDLQDPHLAAAAWIEVGNDHLRSGHPDRAMTAYRDGLERLENAPDVHLAARLHLSLGVAHRLVGAPSEALDSYERALHRFQRVGDRRGEASCRTNLGVLAQQRGLVGEARHQLEQAVALSRATGDVRGLAGALSNLGRALGEAGRLPSARDALHEALELHRRSGERRFEAITLRQLAVLAFEDGELDLAAEQIERAVAAHPDASDPRERASTQLARATIHLDRGDLELASAAAEACAQLAPDSPLWATESAVIRSRVARRRGQPRLDLVGTDAAPAGAPADSARHWALERARVLAELGDPAGGQRLAQACLKALDEEAPATVRAEVLAVVARVLATAGHRPAALAALERAETLLASTTVPPRAPIARKLLSLRAVVSA